MERRGNKFQEQIPAITFKKATADDIKTFVELEKKVANNYTYSGIVTEEEAREEIENCEVYLIYKDGVLVGSCEYEIKGADHAYLSGLVIDPAYQGQGVGKAAMEFRLDKLKNMKRIDVVTHPDNSKIISMYQKEGFVIESRKENYYGDGEPRLVMVKNN